MTYTEALDNLRNRPLFLSPNEYMNSLQTAMAALELAIRLEKVTKLIAGHSDYHGNEILSALYRIQEGKDVTQISPKEYLINAQAAMDSLPYGYPKNVKIQIKPD